MIRCTVEIVPYGIENDKREIFQIEIVNEREVENLGFGNVVCHYSATATTTEPRYYLAPSDHRERLKAVTDIRHNRRDGAAVLLQKSLEALGDFL